MTMKPVNLTLSLFSFCCIFFAAGSVVMPGRVFAITPSECVHLESRSNGGVEFQNSCNETLSVTYCVDNVRSTFSCSRGRGAFGGKTLSPGASERVPEYVNDGGGRVEWAACVYPGVPTGWSPGRQYRCS
jgi:hypothetical protein